MRNFRCWSSLSLTLHSFNLVPTRTLSLPLAEAPFYGVMLFNLRSSTNRQRKKTHKNHIQVKNHVCIMLFVSIGRGDEIELSRILDISRVQNKNRSTTHYSTEPDCKLTRSTCKLSPLTTIGNELGFHHHFLAHAKG